ncbi:MAG: CoA transferase [Ilumatobacteraceae bacterium]
MAPHGIYPTSEDDRWVAIACRDDDDWRQLAPLLIEAPIDRWSDPDALDDAVAAWTRPQTREQVVEMLSARGVPVAPVLLPPERTDAHERNQAWGLWPTVEHSKHGAIRVDGLPVHLSRTDWHVERGGPLLGEDNDRVLGEVLGLSPSEIEDLRAQGVI